MGTINTVCFKSVVDNEPDTNHSGYLTVLMESINTYINAEFSAGRITAKDYSTVYLGALQSAISESTQFTLQELTQNAQIELLTQQASLAQNSVLKVAAEIDAIKADIVRKDLRNAEEIASSQATTTRNDLLSNETLTASQADTLRKDNDSVENIAASKAGTIREDSQTLENIANSKAETIRKDNKNTVDISLVTSQKAVADRQAALLVEQTNTAAYNLANTLPQEVNKLIADISLINAEETSTLSNTTNKSNESVSTVSLQNANKLLVDEKSKSEVKTNAAGGVIDKQVVKLTNEASLTASQDLNVKGDTSNKANESTSNVSLINEKIATEALNNRVAGENGETKDGAIATQIAKVNAEITLLTSKDISEAAQKIVLDKQATLLDTQSTGFIAKHNQMQMKTLYDTWSIEASVKSGNVAASTEMFGLNLKTSYDDSSWAKAAATI